MVSVVLLALAAAPPELALLSKPVDGTTLSVRWQPTEAETPSEPFARLEVHPDETFHGVALANGAVALVRVPGPARDLSFAATLSVVAPGKAERVLATNVVRASRPVLMGARLFIERGSPGIDASDGSIRVDALEVSEVDVASGRLRPVFTTRGFWTHLAGVFGRELVLYVAEPEGARLIAVHVDTLAVRTLKAALPPLAHDFVVDGASKAVLYAIADPGIERWFVERVDLLSGSTSRVAEGDVAALLPTVLPGGVAFMPGPGRGLRWLTRDGVALPARGPGFERVFFVSDGLVVGCHEVPGAMPRPFAVRARDGADVSVAWPKDVIVEPAGVRR
ncbi:MAG: hypothetical protein MUC96_37340 [Myxococcaceae bacterium]|jgi:hypothetical protein|nr:hypothetical protein [Myxococcaceae bacterium]